MTPIPIQAHSAADIVATHLVNLGLCVDATLPVSGNWPVYVSSEPDSPDNVIVVYDTVGVLDGRALKTGVWGEHHGVQIRICATTHKIGFAKAREIVLALNAKATTYQTRIELDGYTYFLQGMSQRGAINSLGKDVPQSKTNNFTVNYIVCVHDITENEVGLNWNGDYLNWNTEMITWGGN